MIEINPAAIERLCPTRPRRSSRLDGLARVDSHLRPARYQIRPPQNAANELEQLLLSIMAERIHCFVSVSYGTVENAIICKAETFVFKIGTRIEDSVDDLLERLPSYRVGGWMLKEGIATIMTELEEAGIPHDPRVHGPVEDIVRMMLLENADRIEVLLRKRTMKLLQKLNRSRYTSGHPLLPVPTVDRNPDPRWPKLNSVRKIRRLTSAWLDIWLTFYMDDQWQYCEPPDDGDWDDMKRSLLAECIGLTPTVT